MTEINILFLTHPYPNYVPDLLLHGLRKLLGPNVVDYPRKECVYGGVLGVGVFSADQLCPNWFPSDYNQIDREDIQKKILKGYFKYIICDVRALPLLQSLTSRWPAGLVLLDGEDFPTRIKPGHYIICRRESDGTDFSIPLPMALPEEIFHWIISSDSIPKSYVIGFLGSVESFYDERRTVLEQIAKQHPDSLFRTSAVPSETDPHPSNRLGRNDYYINLQKCKIVLSLRGAGCDTFRFWENAACNAVHISQHMPLFIPNNFENNRHILRFSDIDQLRRQIDDVLEDKLDMDEIIQEGRNHLVNFHLTTRRAAYLIDKLMNIF